MSFFLIVLLLLPKFIYSSTSFTFTKSEVAIKSEYIQANLMDGSFSFKYDDFSYSAVSSFRLKELLRPDGYIWESNVVRELDTSYKGFSYKKDTLFTFYSLENNLLCLSIKRYGLKGSFLLYDAKSSRSKLVKDHKRRGLSKGLNLLLSYESDYLYLRSILFLNNAFSPTFYNSISLRYKSIIISYSFGEIISSKDISDFRTREITLDIKTKELSYELTYYLGETPLVGGTYQEYGLISSAKLSLDYLKLESRYKLEFKESGVYEKAYSYKLSILNLGVKYDGAFLLSFSTSKLDLDLKLDWFSFTYKIVKDNYSITIKLDSEAKVETKIHLKI